MNIKRNKYLADILDSIACIDEFTGNVKLYQAYENNRMVQAAVERHIEIIGEATKHLIEMEPEIAISNTRKIINTRNKIAHGYDEVENAEVWTIVIKHLPILQSEVERLLGY
jgi:uncharacterized protein with HEPN domain